MILLILMTLAMVVTGSTLKGEPHYCSQEGAQVHVSSALLSVDSCLMCYCKNNIVQCNASNCSTEGCYRLRPRESPECCQTCLGCVYKDKEVSHGQTWSDGCRVFECQAGVLTSSDTQCHVPCPNPSPAAPGECCPRCNECWLEGRQIAEGGSGSPRLDPCVKCHCSGGKLTCTKRSCPVLSCPPNKAIPGPDGCCPVCNGSRDIYVPPGGRCFLRRFYFPGEKRDFDPCTSCQCLQKGFLHCERRTCPPLQCPERYRKGTDECCPSCEYPTMSQVCLNEGVPREHGDTWRHDKCSTCKCNHGQVTCRVDPCEYVNKECPVGFRKVKSPGDCCPHCEEEDLGVCVIYGDPHYKTFDNHHFNFQGECRYELAKDCDQGSFVVRVNNDARRSSYFSWTRSLSLKINAEGQKFKVSLGQRLRTKVNRKREKLPFSKNGLHITRQKFLITVNSSIGLQVNWDGASYVEVKVSSAWRNRTCGLCGNFNHDPRDDQKTRKGGLSLSDEDMANSWQSGRANSCSRRLKRLRLKDDPETQVRTQRLTCLNSALESRDRCKGFNSSVFDTCRSKVDIESYYSSCLLDMCECPSSRLCECDAIIAYVRECQRAKVDVSGWRLATKCGGFNCPYGSMYMKCAPACRNSCKNQNPNPECHMRRCVPGCYCPFSTVLHRVSCILPEKCPRKNWVGRST